MDLSWRRKHSRPCEMFISNGFPFFFFYLLFPSLVLRKRSSLASMSKIEALAVWLRNNEVGKKYVLPVWVANRYPFSHSCYEIGSKECCIIETKTPPGTESEHLTRRECLCMRRKHGGSSRSFSTPTPILRSGNFRVEDSGWAFWMRKES